MGSCCPGTPYSEMLVERREIALLTLMFDMRSDIRYVNQAVANTRQADRITFKTKRSPYFVGSAMWNNLPVGLQKSDTKVIFRTGLKAL